jgi:hypothetical protein
MAGSPARSIARLSLSAWPGVMPGMGEPRKRHMDHKCRNLSNECCYIATTAPQFGSAFRRLPLTKPQFRLIHFSGEDDARAAKAARGKSSSRKSDPPGP